MASGSAPRGGDGGRGRMATAASTLYSDYQSLIPAIRKGMVMIKNMAVDLERENKSDLVKGLEEKVFELLELSNDCAHRAAAIKAVEEHYCPPGDQMKATDFKKLMEDEVEKIKRASPLSVENEPFLRQFKEAVWNVHHAGQPMPGEEQEELVVTGTQCNLRNTTCPLSGKPVIELQSPVRNTECKHIYDKNAIMMYINSKRTKQQCPVAGCPKLVIAEKVICDPMLSVEIEEMRSRNQETARPHVVEDFTEFDEE